MLEVAHSLRVDSAREAQQHWAQTPVKRRLQIIRNLRGEIARNASRLVDAMPSTLRRTRADSLTAEIIPLAEACRFLELEAERILKPESLSSKGRPFWLRSVDVAVHREPFGVVLVIGPANYPLFLVGVQALQALVAGNAVWIKPGRGGEPVASALVNLAQAAGLPSGLCAVLDESVETAVSAMDAGVNKVVLTGSVASGRAVLKQASEHLIPVTAELSGMDPVFVQREANLKLAAAAVRFGSNLNGGETCIAPRRIFVHESIVAAFRAQLGSIDIPITSVRNDDEALELASHSPYALGATIFGEERAARAFAQRIQAGVVVVNDMIVSTADPRVPFGGRGWSGFGSTRGEIGLLAMTTPKAIVVQRAKRLRHLEPVPQNAEEFFLSYLSAVHQNTVGAKLRGWLRFVRALSTARKENQ